MAALLLAVVAAFVASLVAARLVGARPGAVRSSRPARAPGRAGWRRPVPGAPISVGLLVAAAVGSSVLGGPTVGVGTAVAATVGRAWCIRRARRRRARSIEAAAPDLVDLFVVAAAAGHPVPTCLVLVAQRAPPPVRAELVAAAGQVERGAGVVAALSALGGALGPPAGPLVEALVASHRTGAPLAAALGAVAEAARDTRRRQAEEAARRLPVALLFPLVCCVLPAFGLLAVVPLLAASLRSLQP